MTVFTGNTLCLFIVVAQYFAVYAHVSRQGKSILLTYFSSINFAFVHPIVNTLGLGATPLNNNSVVDINDIGERYGDGSQLVCTTTFRPCCSTPPDRHGEWYYPNGTVVPSSDTGWDFYRGRGDDGTVHLNRKSNATIPLGDFYCEIPDSIGVNQTLSIQVYASGRNSTGMILY